MRRLGLWVFLLMLTHYPLQAIGEDKKSKTVVEIERVIAQIDKQRSPTLHSDTVRWSLAKQLASIMRNLNRVQADNLPPRIIDQIAALLSDPDHVVRSFAADALGYIGPSAGRAVPALEKALKEAEVPPGTGTIGPSLDSSFPIRRALQSITGEDMMTPDPYRQTPGSWESRHR